MNPVKVQVRWFKTRRAKTAHARLWSLDHSLAPRSVCNQVSFRQGAWQEIEPYTVESGNVTACKHCVNRLGLVAQIGHWLRGAS